MNEINIFVSKENFVNICWCFSLSFRYWRIKYIIINDVKDHGISSAVYGIPDII